MIEVDMRPGFKNSKSIDSDLCVELKRFGVATELNDLYATKAKSYFSEPGNEEKRVCIARVVGGKDFVLCEQVESISNKLPTLEIDNNTGLPTAKKVNPTSSTYSLGKSIYDFQQAIADSSKS